MDTLQLSPRLRFRTPEFMRWVIVGLSFALVLAMWPFQDLWRVAFWPAHQFNLDDSLPRDVLRNTALAAVALWLAIATTVYVSLANWEWLILTFALSSLYFGLSLFRVLR